MLVKQLINAEAKNTSHFDLFLIPKEKSIQELVVKKKGNTVLLIHRGSQGSKA